MKSHQSGLLHFTSVIQAQEIDGSVIASSQVTTKIYQKPRATCQNELQECEGLC